MYVPTLRLLRERPPITCLQKNLTRWCRCRSRLGLYRGRTAGKRKLHTEADMDMLPRLFRAPPKPPLLLPELFTTPPKLLAP